MTTFVTPERHTQHRPRGWTALVSALAVVVIALSTALVLRHVMTAQPTLTRPVTGPQSADQRPAGLPSHAPAGSDWQTYRAGERGDVAHTHKNRTGLTTAQFEHGHGGLD